jgi:uncharacterized protein YegP (UPF0339 family)
MRKLHFWKAKDGWRWKLVASNGRLIAEGGEAYTRDRDCIRAFYRAAEVIRHCRYRIAARKP